MPKGFLAISTTAAHRIIPVKNVRVIIAQNDAENNIFFTNDSGRAPLIEISAPDLSFSESPEPEGTPFSTLSITAEKDGFYTVFITNAQVFPGRTTTLNINMVPIPEYREDIPLNINTIPQNL